jgi:hypothetical protein
MRRHRAAHLLLLWRQVVVVPLRVNVNLKALTLEELVERRKVVALYACALGALCTFRCAPTAADTTRVGADTSPGHG